MARVTASAAAIETGPSGSMVDAAYRLMRSKILDNVWPPGHRALEQGLALELGMSRTPVREALIRLQKEGLVEVVPRHGMRVLPVSPDDMREIYELLTAIEPMAAEMVARKNLPERDLKPLIDASRAMGAALKAKDLDAWAAADERYHRLLIALAGNRLMMETVQALWDRAHRARMVTLRLRPIPENSTKEHTAIVDTIRAGDAGGAARLYRAHRERGSRELLALLEKAHISGL